jgi:hypothetical protein
MKAKVFMRHSPKEDKCQDEDQNEERL